MKPRVSTWLVVVLLCISVPGQSPALKGQPQTVHVQGTTFGPDGDSVVPRTKVTLHSEQVTRIVTADDKGFYQTDLPVGFYTMAAEAQDSANWKYSRGFQEYRRPLFRVTVQATLTLNAKLMPQSNNCEVVALGEDADILSARKDVCGGEELFPYPSDEGIPFQLSIRYPRRSPGEQGYIYSGDMRTTNFYTPVVVAYNLTTLQAKQVVYDAQNRTIAANGDVVFLDESGATHHSATLTLKIENGHATPVE